MDDCVNSTPRNHSFYLSRSRFVSNWYGCMKLLQINLICNVIKLGQCVAPGGAQSCAAAPAGYYATANVVPCLTCPGSAAVNNRLKLCRWVWLYYNSLLLKGATSCDCTANGVCSYNGNCQTVPAGIMIFASFLSKEWNHVLLIYSGFYSPAGISDCLVCAASTKKGFLLIHHFFFPLINLWIFAIGAGKCPCTAAGYCFLNGVCVAAPAGYYSPASVSDCFTWFDSSAIVFLYCCFFINEIMWLMIFLQSGRKSWSADLLLHCRWLAFFKVTFLLLHFLIVLIPLGYCSTGGNCAITAPGYYSPSGFTDCIQCVTALKPGISSLFWRIGQ